MRKEKQKALFHLKTACGQLAGIIRMIEEDRYCMDIANQIVSSTVLLKKANMYILSAYLHSCVCDDVHYKEASDKVKEIEMALFKLLP